MLSGKLTIAVAFGSALLFLSPRVGIAQDYPTSPVTYLIGSSPGGGADVLGRVIVEGLSKTLGGTVVADTRAGAGGTLAAAVAAEAKPDGYTILQTNINHTAGEALYPQRGYNLLEDFVPITRPRTEVRVHPRPLRVGGMGDRAIAEDHRSPSDIRALSIY